MSGGWIKLHKSLLDWEWFKDHKTVHVFNYCLLKANFKEGRFQGKIVPAGSFVTGRKQIAQDTGLSEQEVRTAIFKLKSTSNLTIKSTSKYSIISICNWEKYQAEQPTKPPRSNQRATTIEEEQEREEDIYEFSFSEFWQIYPKTRAGASDKAFKKFKQKAKQFGIEKIMAGVRAYAKSREVAEGYAKGCAAWLNDDRFLSEYGQSEKKMTIFEKARRMNIGET